MFPFIAHLNNGGLLVFIQHQQFTQSFTHCMFSPNLVYPPGEYNDGAIINEGGQRLIGANTLIHIHFANLNATLLSRRSLAIRCSSSILIGGTPSGLLVCNFPPLVSMVLLGFTGAELLALTLNGAT